MERPGIRTAHSLKRERAFETKLIEFSSYSRLPFKESKMLEPIILTIFQAEF